MPEGITQEEFFKELSIPRNKELMRIFRDMELVEQLASGVPRILKSYGKECFHFSDNFIRMTFPVFERTNSDSNLNGGVNGGVKLLLNFVEKNPGVKASKLSKEFDLPQRTVERWLKKLKEENKIEYKGSAKTGGYWKIMEDKNPANK